MWWTFFFFLFPLTDNPHHQRRVSLSNPDAKGCWLKRTRARSQIWSDSLPPCSSLTFFFNFKYKELIHTVARRSGVALHYHGNEMKRGNNNKSKYPLKKENDDDCWIEIDHFINIFSIFFFLNSRASHDHSQAIRLNPFYFSLTKKKKGGRGIKRRIRRAIQHVWRRNKENTSGSCIPTVTYFILIDTNQSLFFFFLQ